MADAFIKRYGSKLEGQYPELKNIKVICYETMPSNGNLSIDDTPYLVEGTTNPHEFELHTDDNIKKMFNFSPDEEMALIAHEFGHIIHKLQGKGQSGPADECFADSVAAKVVGKDITLSALQKIRDYQMAHIHLFPNLGLPGMPKSDVSSVTQEIDQRIENLQMIP